MTFSLLVQLEDGSKRKIAVRDEQSIQQAVQEAESLLNSQTLKPLEPNPWLVKNVSVDSKRLIKLLTRKYQKSQTSTISLVANRVEQMDASTKSVDAVYNRQAEALLASQIVTIKNRPSDKNEKGLSIKRETLMDQVRSLQAKTRDGVLSAAEYEAELKSLLSEEVLEDGSAKLRMELETLKPQLFAAESNRLLGDTETRHQDLHAMHVLPVVRALQRAVAQENENNEMVAQENKVFALPLHTWKHFTDLLSDCHSKTPLLFPHSLVVTVTLHHKELLRSVSKILSPDRLLVSSADDALLPLLKDFARVMCSVLKETETLRRARRTMKVAFHHPTSVTSASFVRALEDVSVSLGEKSSASALRQSVERIFFKLAVNDSVHCAEVVRRLAETETETPTEEPSVVADQVNCALCARVLVCLFVSTGQGPMCVNCWLNHPTPSKDDRVTRLVSPLSQETPVPATHLLTHQRNLWESKTGTRHARLPDQRHAVISTAVHHLVKRRDKTSSTEKGDTVINRDITKGDTIINRDMTKGDTIINRDMTQEDTIIHRDMTKGDTRSNVSKPAPQRDSITDVSKLDTERDATAAVCETSSEGETAADVSDREAARENERRDKETGEKETRENETRVQETREKERREDETREEERRHRETADGETEVILSKSKFSESNKRVGMRTSLPAQTKVGDSVGAKASGGRSLAQSSIDQFNFTRLAGDDCKARHLGEKARHVGDTGKSVGDVKGRRRDAAEQKKGEANLRAGQRRRSSLTGDGASQKGRRLSAGEPRQRQGGEREVGKRNPRVSELRKAMTERQGSSRENTKPSFLSRSLTTSSPSAKTQSEKATFPTMATSKKAGVSLRRSCPGTSRPDVTRARERDSEEMKRALTMGVADPLLTRLLAGTRPTRRTVCEQSHNDKVTDRMIASTTSLVADKQGHC